MTFLRVFTILFAIVLPSVAVAGPLSTPLTDRSVAGDWKSSGGTGIVCFQTVGDAKAYDQVVGQNISLSDDLISKIATLETLEHWEKRAESFDRTHSSAELLEILRKRLLITAPLIAVQLDAVAERIHQGSWQQSGVLEPTHDADPQRPLDQLAPECRQIQLVVRVNSVVEAGQMPDIHVYFDARLFEKLDPLNRAMLEVHERLYVLGRQVGHGDSMRTRLLVRTVFDEDFWKAAEIDSPSMAMKIQNRFDYQLGNYIDIFYSFLKSKDVTPFSPASRFQSLYQVVHKLSARLHACLQNNVPPKQDCRANLFEQKFLATLTDEEQFMYVYRWILTRSAGSALPNSETVAVEWKDREMKVRSAFAMLGACKLIQGNAPAEVPFLAAARYCQDRSKALSQSPMGKDRN